MSKIAQVIGSEGGPVEIAPGRGDLRYSSAAFTENLRRSLPLVDRTLSFQRIYASQPMIGAAVGWFMRQAMRVPLKLYRRTGDDSRVRIRPGDHPLAQALVRPWDRGSQAAFVWAQLGPLLVHGNGVTELLSGAKETVEFLPCDWRFAQPKMPFRGSIVAWELDLEEPRGERTRAVDDVLHVATWSPFGPIGVSPLEQLGTTIAIDDAASRFQRSLFRNGARPPSAITSSDGFLGLRPEERKELLDNLREDIEAIYAGPENAGRPALLPPGLDWKPVGHTAVEAQLIEQRTVARTEAVAVYGLTPHTLGMIERSAELGEQRQMAYTDGLAPPLLMIEAAINSQVVWSLLGEADLYVEFDFAGILRGDRLKEIQALREAIASALMTPNEGRTVLNQPRSQDEGMDTFYLPRNNLIPVGVPYQEKGMVPGTAAPGGQAPEAAVPREAERLATTLSS